MTNRSLKLYMKIPGHLQIALLDRATDELVSMDPRPCGAPSRRYACPPDCSTCHAEVMRRVEEKMLAMLDRHGAKLFDGSIRELAPEQP